MAIKSTDHPGFQSDGWNNSQPDQTMEKGGDFDENEDVARFNWRFLSTLRGMAMISQVVRLLLFLGPICT